MRRIAECDRFIDERTMREREDACQGKRSNEGIAHPASPAMRPLVLVTPAARSLRRRILQIAPTVSSNAHSSRAHGDSAVATWRHTLMKVVVSVLVL